MNSQQRLVQPPRLAAWLITLFAPTQEAESILGDLLEEFSTIVKNSGVAVARGWYWRQASKTVVHLLGSEVRAEPWLMLLAVAAGFWSVGFATRWSQGTIQAFLNAHQVYERHPDAYLFWLKFPLQIGRLVLCTAIGATVALAAKRIEMAAVIALASVQMALFAVGTLYVIVTGGTWLHWFLFMLQWNLLSAIAIVAGGVLVKTRRSGWTRGSTGPVKEADAVSASACKGKARRGASVPADAQA